jgi:hypothetical protein
MSRQTRAVPKVRLNLDLTPDSKETLAHLRMLLDADSQSEAVRRAIRFTHDLVQIVRDGGKLVARRPGRSDETVMVV